MRGGTFLAQGGETCVYVPQLPCWTETKDGTVLFGTEYENHVSRLVLSSHEIIVQSTLKAYLYEHPQFGKFFNLASEICDHFVFTNEDRYHKKYDEMACDIIPELQKKLAEVTYVDGSQQFPEGESILDSNTRILRTKHSIYNLITPLLGVPFHKYYDDDDEPSQEMKSWPKRSALKRAAMRLLRALIDMKGEWGVYFDCHLGNISWNFTNSELVLFDFGISAINNFQYLKRIDEILNNVMFNQKFPHLRYSIVLLKSALEANIPFVNLKPIWDLVSILGSLDLQYGQELKKQSNPLFPNIEACITEIGQYLVSTEEYSPNVVHEICNRTMFDK
jgi:hypothetical protein